MKFILSLILITVSTNVFAPMLPGLAESEQSPKRPTLGSNELQNSDKELRELIQAQTKTIKLLSNELKLLEQRIDKIEREQRK